MPPHVPDPADGRGPGERPSDSNREPQVNLGGADAVQKTTGLGPRGSASPDALRDEPAAIPSGRGISPMAWVAIALLVLVLVFYLSGLF